MSDFNFTQSVPATSWIINHNLNVTSVIADSMINNNGALEKTTPLSVIITDNNNVTVNFSTPQTGSIRLVTQGGLFPSIATYLITITSATFDNIEYSIPQDGFPRGLSFNDDGTKLITVGNSTDSVYQHDLTVPYDISTASYSGISQVLTGLNSPSAIVFNNDGSKMFISNTTGGNYKIFEYSLSTNYLITSLTQTAFLDVSAQGFSITSVAFNLNGTKMFVLDNSGTPSVDLYNLSIGWDLTTGSYSGTSFALNVNNPSASGLAFNPSGSEMYVSDPGANKGVYKYDLNVEFDISSGSYNGDFLSVPFPHDPEGLTFNDIGTKLYLISLQTDKVFQYSTNI